MATAQMGRVTRHLRRAVLLRDGGGLTDGQLLERFVTRREEEAFEALVRRHGAMVLGVCRRVLRDHHDAEDAFQATFLVLVRRAACVVPREAVAGWLYGVARQTALKARAVAARRRARERQVREMPEREVQPDPGREWQELLDRELGLLPEEFRAPVVLCDLGGQTRKEAARQLGWPEGTLAGRLARARAVLARRLARRGVGPAGALALAAQSAPARVPPALVSATVKAAGQAGAISTGAAALAEGVMSAMRLTGLKAVVVLLAVGVLGSGAGLLTHRVLAGKPADKAVKGEPAKSSREVTGVVESVDSARHTLTFGKKGPLGGKTFEVDRSARVLIEGARGWREGTLADVAGGALVTLRLSADGKKAVRVRAGGPRVEAVLKSVEARTLTVSFPVTKGEPPPDRTFRVAEGAKVFLEGAGKKGKGGTLAELPAGSVLTLKLTGDQKAVLGIAARGPSVKGTLKSVDARKGTLTALVKEAERTAEKTFPLAKAVAVSVEGTGKKGESGKLADLPAGASVTLRLSLDARSVVAVHAEGPRLRGVVKSADARKNVLKMTLLAKGEKPADRTFAVARGASVQVDGRKARLADVPADAEVSVKLSADQKAALAVEAEGPAVRGVVRGNAGERSVTVGNKSGDETYDVSAETRVVVEDRKEGKLSDLIDGTVVSARLSADRKMLVGTIRAEGPSFRGLVKSVDPDGGTVTLTVGGKGGGVGGEDKEFRVTKATAVVTAVYGVPRKLSDLKVGREVVLRLTLDQKSAGRITILGE